MSQLPPTYVPYAEHKRALTECAGAVFTATIERCAQVAKKFVEECGLESEQLVAAIRALKNVKE